VSGFRNPVDVAAPHTRADVVNALRAVHVQSAAYWRSLSEAAFWAPIGSAWSPAEHVRHLTTSMRALTRGLGLPRPLLLLLFGRARAPLRPYDEVRTTYYAALDAGGQAGRFAPSALEVRGDLADARERVLSHHAQAVGELVAAINAWTDASVARYRLPHPLLGKLPVLEMLYFTVYHNQHHAVVAARRAAGLPARASAP